MKPPFEHTRRSTLNRCLVSMAALLLPSVSSAADGSPLTPDAARRDPDLPFIGNADGDVTVVEYFDYRCPYCKRAHAPLARAIAQDGRTKLILRDWPILGGVSIYAAKLALAARYQGRFPEAHDALITASLPTEEKARAAVEHAGVDLSRATHDMSDHAFDIDDILTRNAEQARALGFRGTPSFVVGALRFFGALEDGDYLKAIQEARVAAR